MSLVIKNQESIIVTRLTLSPISNRLNGYWIWCSIMKCTSIWLEVNDAIGCDYSPWGIHEFGEICVERTFVTTRRVGKDTCALRTSCRSRSSAKDRQWFQREISWGIYITQLLIDQWPRRSWIAQHYSLRVPAGGHTSGGSMLKWYLVWSDCTDGVVVMSGWLIFLLFQYQWWGLEHGSSGWCTADLLRQIFFFTMLWDVFCGSCWFLCKDVNSTAQLQKFFYFMVSDMICFFIHVSSACFQSGLFHAHVKSFASETVEVAMFD